jgi:peptidylprolyl isomerase
VSRKAAVVLALLALAMVGCGGDSDSSEDLLTYEPWTPPVTSERQERTDASFLAQPSKNGLIGPELKPVIPDQPPPEFLSFFDLIDSFSIATASAGDRVTVQYVGTEYESGKKFASSWDEGKPFTFTLGTGEVIEGWEEGLQRMEIGDRREIVVPPDLATGGSQMKGLPKDTTLVFVLESLDIKEK